MKRHAATGRFPRSPLNSGQIDKYFILILEPAPVPHQYLTVHSIHINCHILNKIPKFVVVIQT